jgi:pimeloyl-ACP methyl ester carboxylesterase
MDSFSRRQAICALAVGSLGIINALSVGAHPVDTAEFVRIGGLNQWVVIQGRNHNSPVILFLHGGPGEAMSPFLDLFRPYESDFTVANWDQRGAGKTYGRIGTATAAMDLEQFILDTIDVANHLRQRLSRRKIVLVGHSWGASLGLQVAKRRPDLFYAFLGSGQPVSLKLSILSQERFARTVLSDKKDEVGLKNLDEVAQLPISDPKRRFATRMVLMGPEDQTFLAREESFTGPKPWPTKGDVADWIGGYTFTSDVLVPKILDKDPIDVVGLEIPVPFIVVQGSEDHITPTDVVREYLDKVTAPTKAFVEIRGGHFACYTNPEGFLGALKQHVLPLCSA